MSRADLYIGDCVAVTSAFAPASVDMACFSTPYDLLKAKDYEAGQRFDMDVWRELCRVLYTVLKPGAVACFVVNDAIVGGDRSCSSLEMVLAAKQAGFLCHDLIPWVKASTPYMRKGALSPAWELCVVLSRGRIAYTSLPTKQNSRAGALLKRKDGSTYRVKAEGVERNVIDGPEFDVGASKSQSGKTYPHPAPYPPALTARFISSWCRPGGVVLDCFTGISSTGMGVALAGEGRRFIGVDCSRKYVSWSQERLLSTGYYEQIEVHKDSI